MDMMPPNKVQMVMILQITKNGCMTNSSWLIVRRDIYFFNPLCQMKILLLDNIRSILNVGALFRTCDGAGFERIILT